MISIRTASRLHFGLINPGRSLAGRRFGGAGLMIDNPGVELEMVASNEWSVEGPLAPRGRQVLYRLLERIPAGRRRPHRIIIRSSAAEHVGLGTGTQLSLAMARLYFAGADLPVPDAETLAELTGRGRRSAIGVHGFCTGGFLIDDGVCDEPLTLAPVQTLAPVAQRLDFPSDWRLVLVLPTDAAGISGDAESKLFDELLDRLEPAAVEERRRLASCMAETLRVGDFAGFSAALYEFNRRAGEAFASIQGGPYAGRCIADAVEWFRGMGAAGTGQSSWGPVVFALARDAEEAQFLLHRLRRQFALPVEKAWVAAAANAGATLAHGR